VSQISEPFLDDAPIARITHRSTDWFGFTMLCLWMGGFGVIALLRLQGWLRIRSAVQSSTPIDVPVAVEVRSAPGLLEPGVVGLRRPVLFLPVGITERLTPLQLEAVLAHELCHIRRRDNLSASVHMGVEAMFWFHPLVWWIGARLVEERERACDEEVLRLGNEAHVYAEGILNVCKFYVESPLVCVSGVTGADLKRRVRDILDGRAALHLSRAKKITLAIAGAAAITAPIIVGVMNAPYIKAQSAAASHPQFEVTSVKLHVGGLDRNTLVPPTALPGGRFVSKFPLGILIAYAYKLPINQNGRLTGMPNWVQGTTIYDVEATSVMPPGLSVRARDDRVREMVQALLEDRFKLVIRRESKEMPVYALLVAKGGPKLQRADIDEKDCPEASLAPLGPQSPSTPLPNVCHAINGGMGRGLHARAVNMSDLAAVVENWTDRPLLDKTGIEGLYRFETAGWLPMDPMASRSDIPDALTVFQMFEKLGLKMEPQKGVVEVYVIDHLEKPSEN
jgi:bla regulator protein BlaR1